MQFFPVLAMSSDAISLILMVVVGFAFIYLFMIRPQKKREREEADMRNSLAVGDEITTIGGIVGKIVSLREETVVIETTKDKTHIRFLRGAIRTIDVKAEDSAAPVKQKEAAPTSKKGKKTPAIQPQADKTVAEKVVETEVAVATGDAPVEATKPADEETAIQEVVETEVAVTAEEKSSKKKNGVW